MFVDHDAVRPVNSESIVALAQPVSREERGNFPRKVARPRLAAFLPRVYGDDYPLPDHCLTLSPAAEHVAVALAGSADGAEPVDRPRIEPNMAINNGRAIILNANA